ncbi:MAG: glycosyltransferase [Sedimentisphaerales bacterium]|nr:glycosyltransferase [Sedimentisphaerales bacterium]
MNNADNCWQSEQFRDLSDRLLAQIRSGTISEIPAQIDAFLSLGHDSITAKLLGTVKLALRGDHAGIVAEFDQIRELIDPQQAHLMPGLYNIIWFDSQLALPRHANPVNRICHQNFRNNIKALEQVNPKLAGEIRKARAFEQYRIIRHWTGLHFFDTNKVCLLTMAADIREKLASKVLERTAFAIDGICSGQEIIYYLNHQYKGLHGMARANYLLEEDLTKVRSFLELGDFSDFICNEELIIFAGANACCQMKDTLLTCRYPVPMVRLEQGKKLDNICSEVLDFFAQNDLTAAISGYYESEEFTRRLRQIAAGELKPRILISTCRWTSFLKYCAADFDRAFQKLSCQTYYLIENSDTQTLTSRLHEQIIEQMKPDVVFMVSHARTSLPYLPRQLPVICFMQDKCGPLLSTDDIGAKTGPYDLFICMLNDFQDYLRAKGVNPGQTCVMPVPADPEMFYRLGPESKCPARYQAEIAFVKHGSSGTQEQYQQFKRDYINNYFSGGNLDFLTGVFDQLMNYSLADTDRCIYEPQMQQFCMQFLHSDTPEKARNFLAGLVTTFYLYVYSANWRFRFLEALAQSNYDLALFGNNWQDNTALSRFARGPVGRGQDLNCVYNHCKINLSINHATSMHQRLVECSLAGGFIMVAGHDRAFDGSYAGDYYMPEKELILFHSISELLEKTRYYLEHEQQRCDIAQNMQRRSLDNYSTHSIAGNILNQFRNMLKESGSLL